MRQVCLACSRQATHQQLYCQETYCPAEQAPILLERGEWLGDIEIFRVVSILQTSVVYVGMLQGNEVLVKVAHPERTHIERLKREAQALIDLPEAFKKVKNAARVIEILPTILPAYAGHNLEQAPYGKVSVAERDLYFVVFQHFEAESLQTLLAQRPQPGFYETCWIVQTLAETLALMQSQGWLHLALAPESVLVRLDYEKQKHQLLLLDLGVAAKVDSYSPVWYPHLVAPAYTAPELLQATPRASYESDVYGIGLIFFEMLTGQPRFPRHIVSKDRIDRYILQAPALVSIERNLSKKVHPIVLKSIDPNPRQRYAAVVELNTEMKPWVSSKGRHKVQAQQKHSRLFLLVVMVLVLAFVCAVVVSVSQIESASLLTWWV